MATPLTGVPANILTETHYQQIKNALDVIASIQQHIDMAARAGIDVSQHRDRLKQAHDQLLALKNVYFPGR
jgi:hypothetical protein